MYSMGNPFYGGSGEPEKPKTQELPATRKKVFKYDEVTRGLAKSHLHDLVVDHMHRRVPFDEYRRKRSLFLEIIEATC